MKIAITGGAGFIGARLAQSLREDRHRIVIIDTVGAKPVDLLDRDAVMAAVEGCDAIYHLAAEHRDDVFPRSRYYDVNAKGTKNVLDAADAHDIRRVIFTSTFALYGLNTGMPDEDSAPQPFNDYGRSKLEAETHVRLWARRDPARTATIIRPVVVFGEGNKGNVYTLINQIANGKFVMIGDGKNRKSMAYVGNVAAFLKHCLTEAPGLKIYNYADKPDLDMNILTSLICARLGKEKSGLRLPYGLGLGAGYTFDALARVSGKRFPISAVRVRKFCADTTCAADRYKETGFRPAFTLEEGLMRMIDADFKAPREKAA